MTASVNVVLDKRDDAITLPTSAVSTTGTTETVTVKAKDGTETLAGRSRSGCAATTRWRSRAVSSVGDQVVITTAASTGGERRVPGGGGGPAGGGLGGGGLGGGGGGGRGG